jgi:membrane associated rhomboid family serine protease
MSSFDAPRFAFPELTPAIKRLLLVNAAVFLANALLGGALSDAPSYWFAVSWPGLWDGYGLGLLRLVGYQFTHDWLGIGHIFWNMLTLYFFGTMAERSLGYRGTYKLYLLGGIVAAIVHLAVAAPQGKADVHLVGASGSCYAFLVYAACMAPRSLVILLVVPVQLRFLAGALVFIGLYATYVEFRTTESAGVAHSAHLGGAAFGFVAHRFGWFRDFTPYAYQPGILAGMRQRWQRWRQERSAAASAADQQELDRILEKVHRDGLQSLSGSERRVLERQSRRSRKG